MKNTKKRAMVKFVQFDYRTLYDLDVTINEMFLIDMIAKLSGYGGYYANKKLENIAQDMKLTKNGVRIMRDRLIERKLLVKGIGNRLKTSEKANSVYFLDEDELEKAHSVNKKAHSVDPKSTLSGAKTSVEKYYRNTKNKKALNSGGEVAQPDSASKARARAIAESIKQRASMIGRL